MTTASVSEGRLPITARTVLASPYLAIFCRCAQRQERGSGGTRTRDKLLKYHRDSAAQILKYYNNVHTADS